MGMTSTSVSGPVRLRRRCSLQIVITGLLIFTTLGAFAADIEIPRRWASPTPVIDGVISPGEWNFATMTPLANGRMYTVNNATHLFVMLDVIQDTSDEPPAPGPADNDYYSLAFDVDRNRGVTPNVDLFYDSCADGRIFIKGYYLSGSTFTGCQDVSPESQGAIGFWRTFNSNVPHRFWEFKIDLAEIGVDPASMTIEGGNLPYVRMNVGIHSANPPLHSAEPDPDFWPDWGNDVYRLQLSTNSTYPPGSTGPTFAGVGLVPRNFIDGLGYANLAVAGYPYSATAAPFGGTLNIFGNWSNLWFARHARSYRILYSKDGGPATVLKQTWTNFKYNWATGNWDPVAFGPDANDRYQVPAPWEVWYLTNLLVIWKTPGLGDGTYTLSLQLFDDAGNPLPAPPGNSLTLFIVNTPPTVKIDRVLFNGSEVNACDIVTQGAADGFNFDITVDDANGALGGYNLYGIYGNNQSTPNIAIDSYPPHADEHGPERWNGPGSITVPPAGMWQAGTSCAYSFILHAHSRAQNGYGLIFPHVNAHVSLTILVPGAAATESAGALSSSGDCKTCGEEAASGSCIPLGLTPDRIGK